MIFYLKFDKLFKLILFIILLLLLLLFVILHTIYFLHLKNACNSVFWVTTLQLRTTALRWPQYNLIT